MLHHKELSLKSPNKLTQTVQTLNSNLKAIQPNNSEAVQLITYTLLATAIVGIMVYHYLKSQELGSHQAPDRSHYQNPIIC
jgi:hypothetical protein